MSIHYVDFMDEIRNGLLTKLQEQGYGFHSAVVNELEGLYQENKSRWLFQTSELPVENNSKETQIDIVLKHNSKPYFMVLECKRANPAYSNWCFVKTHSYRRDQDDEKSIFERVFIDLTTPISRDLSASKLYKDIYDVPIEVKSNKKGNSGGPGKGEINNAVTQVCKSVNGFMNFLNKNNHLIDVENGNVIIPVIITTANLWVGLNNLKESELTTGNIKDLSITEVSSIALRYHLTPSLTNKLKYKGTTGGKIGDIFERKFTRTIMIVSASGLEDFLNSCWDFESY